MKQSAPITKPSDDPQCKVMVDTMQRLELQLVSIKQRICEIEPVLASPKPEHTGNAWQAAMLGQDQEAVGPQQELLEELEHLRQQEQFVASAIDEGRVEVDGILGRVSAQICESHRPLFVEDIIMLLNALEQARTINDRLIARRAALEDAGIRSDSIPFCYFAGVSQIELFKVWIRDHFPEIKIN
jgi:hypothetical protein